MHYIIPALIMLAALIADAIVRHINTSRALQLAASEFTAERDYQRTRSLRGYHARRALPQPWENLPEYIHTIGGLACLAIVAAAWIL